ncbi:MAG: hypothetical protein LCI00_16685 [Chloroflexi bacterium]|nr:hypothetical protein [Chloroflexota bacterium]MCC6896627.1 hypothetical protein [Anaerolineae bacterium]
MDDTLKKKIITDAEIKYLHALVQPLIGMKPWQIFRQFGSYLYFDFGELELTKWGERGAIRLVILDCAWRIENEDRVLVGCDDVHPIMDERIKQLEDQAIVSLTVTKPWLDTAISFENGLTLRLFARSSGRNPKHDFWFFSDPTYTLSIGTGGTYQYYDHTNGFGPRKPVSEEILSISETDIQSVQIILNRLIGTKVKYVEADSFENPVIFFKEKGEKVLWELTLFNLDWRLETDTEFLAGSLDEHRSYEPLHQHLKSKRLLSIEITRPAFDTTFMFEDNIKLVLFTYIAQRAMHYKLTMPDKRTLEIGRDSKWSITEPDQYELQSTKKRKKK